MIDDRRLVPAEPLFYSSLHSVEDQKHSLLWKSSNCRSVWANNYFDRLKQIHNLLWATHDKVAIAMIDTGINSHHPEMAKYIQNQSITLSRGFPGDLNLFDDKWSHGTHGASILLKTAPNAKLLIGRVFDDNGKMPYKNKYPDVVEVMLTFYWLTFSPLGNSLSDTQSSRRYFNFIGILL